ncbi:exosome catalytic subunit dis3 [Physocladia obscura]|uniref:Ribosomal RNA-processing protein 44 n=1 Tax=Physocladia obscura TaxID=109957 RepID=A0AAD5T6D1_9FUNG|nr:exosome catalytic subunit dis3 [Physocladia obscura]
MLQSKVHVRKTRRGGVIKVVKELYLRDDIHCGVAACGECNTLPVPTTPAPTPFLLASAASLAIAPPASTVVSTGARHYLLPDTNIFMHQIDLMEHKAFTNVIVLQTVLEELRHRSDSVYERVRALVKDSDKAFYVFSNEFSRDTFVKKLKDESPNDRNDRGITSYLAACLWYAKHVPGGTTVVLLTDDADNRRKATTAGLFAYSVREYVEGMKKFPELCDMIAVVDENVADEGKKFTYSDHITASQINAGLKSGAFCQGSMNISFHNFLEGSIFTTVNGEDTTVKIVGRSNLNRAMQGDIVAVKILPKSAWPRSNDNVVIEAEEDDESLDKIDPNTLLDPLTAGDLVGEDDSMEIDEKFAAASAKYDFVRTGCVVGIIQRKWRQYCGTIETPKGSSSNGQQSVFFWPMDKRIPKIRIRTRQARQISGQRIMVAIDAWPKNTRYPTGHFVKSLGAVGDRRTETDVILLEHDVRFMPFSKQVLSFLPAEGESWIVKKEDLAGRMDFRHLDVCSIDPPGLYFQYRRFI